VTSGALTYGLIAGSLVLAAAFGALRAATVRIWIADGQAWSRGNWLTAVLWVAAAAAALPPSARSNGPAERRHTFRLNGTGAALTGRERAVPGG
jgi:hypothetical protein